MTSHSIHSLENNALDNKETVKPSVEFRFLLVICGLFFLGYVGNILLGVSAVRFDSGVFYLSDVYEAAMLFGSVSTGMLFVLLNEE